MKVKCAITNRGKGFTLIEVSIVLVIIGLIVGGVLVGRDLIEAATLRKQVSQLEEYSTAINTFKLKYSEIPGNMLYTNVQAFGLGTSGVDLRCNSPFCSGGGRLICSDGDVQEGFQSGDCGNFWVELGNANLIAGKYDGYGPGGGANQIIGTNFPASKFNNAYGVIAVDGSMVGGGIWLMPGAKGYIYWIIDYFNGGGGTSIDSMLTPLQAYQL